MSSIYNFLQFNNDDPIHPSYLTQNGNVYSIIDANTYISQVETNSIIRPCLSITTLTLDNIYVEIENSTVFYFIIPPTSGDLYFLDITFSLVLSPKGKFYYYTQTVYDNDWYWPDSGSGNINSLIFIYRQEWSPNSCPYDKHWTLIQILYKLPTPIEIEYIETNIPHIINLFSTNCKISGNKFIPYQLSSFFISNYDIIPNMAYQKPFPI